jgi:toxin YhaV
LTDSEVRIQNGWSLYGHPFFIARLTALIDEVEALAEANPEGFHRHPHYTLLECVQHQVETVVPRNPGDAVFSLGNTLGKDHRHWRRAKKALPQRYRLFFQYRSTAPQTIIYAWLNDEMTLRKAGAKTDVYTVFRHMLSSGKIPDTYSVLLQAAQSLPI